MTLPHPVWGIDVAHDRLRAALVRKSEDGFEILERRERPIDGDVLARLERVVEFQRERGVRDAAVQLAVPDETGALVVARVGAECAEFSNDELRRELYQHTPYEPTDAELRFRLLTEAGRARTFQVVAVPWDSMRTRREVVARLDLERAGLAFAGTAAMTGARTHGLLGPGDHLVDVVADRTLVYAVDAAGVRRYQLPVGVRHLSHGEGATETARRLGGDIRRIAEYHHAQHLRHGDPDDPEESFRPSFRAIGAWTASGPMVEAVLAGVGANGPSTATAVSRVIGDAPDPADLPAWLTAIGAAVEALSAPTERVTLRAPPAVLPPTRTRVGWIVGGVGLAIAAGAAALVALDLGREREPTDVEQRTSDTAEQVEAVPLESTRAEALRRRIALDTALAHLADVLTSTGAAPAALDLRTEDAVTVGARLVFPPDATPEVLDAVATALIPPGDQESLPDGTTIVSWSGPAPSAEGNDDATPGAPFTWPRAQSLVALARGRAAGETATTLWIGTTRETVVDTARSLLRGLTLPGCNRLEIAPDPDAPGLHAVRLHRSAVPRWAPEWPEVLHTDDLGLAEVLLGWRTDTETIDAPAFAGALSVTRLPALEVLAREDGVTIRWPVSIDGSQVEWRAAGVDDWSKLADAGASAGGLDAPVAASRGRFEFRLTAPDRAPGPVSAVDLDLAADARPVRMLGHQRLALLLTRPWQGATVTKEVAADVGPAPITTVGDAAVELRSELRVASIRWEIETLEVRVPVPAIGPDGRVLRDAGGAVREPDQVSIELRRPRARVELERSGDGLEIWFGKMTDG